MIETRNLTKRYGEKVALHGLNLKVEAGEVFAFLGPNGAGKTTTIKILTGLIRPSSGSAFIGGHDIVADGLAAKGLMSYVPDQPFLYDKLTAGEFLRMMGDLHGMDERRMEERIARLSESFELKDFVDDLCESYSHGMKQRVVLAAALLPEPKVLIIDEPMVGLDPKSARTAKDMFQRLAREQKVAIFMSTHTLSVAEEVADRIGILGGGRLLFLGKIQELRGLRADLIRPGHERLEDLFLELTGGNGNGAGAQEA